MKTLRTHPPKFTVLLHKYLDSYFALNDLSTRTKANYSGYVKLIDSFLGDCDSDKIDVSLMEDFFIYLRGYGDISFGSRLVEICKRTIKWSVMKGIVEVNLIADVPCRRKKPKDVVHLEFNELEKVINAHTDEIRLQRVRDLYVFQALSGLSYGDLKRYRIIKDDKGEWIYCQRKKNGNEFWVPFKGILKEIHEKYSGNLPRPCVSHYNKSIRDLMGVVGIQKYLTSHTARKTFATLMYEKGYSIETIADMMGHLTPVTTQKHYLKKSRKRLEMEVKMLETG